MFDFYIAMDPSLWWNDKYLLKTANTHLATFPAAEKRFWFAGSNAKDINGATKKLAATLTAAKQPNLIWTYSDEPKEKHQTIYRATKEKALIWTLNKK
jgi:predicted alpha/beta superfamily hydrolase